MLSQLGLLQRFYQTLKTEEVVWKLYERPDEARKTLEIFRRRYILRAATLGADST